MSTSAYLSVVDLLIFSAPEGVSPFIYAANYIAHIMPDKVIPKASSIQYVLINIFISARVVL